MTVIYAHCYRSGKIVFDEEARLDGMLPLCSGAGKAFMGMVASLAEITEDGDLLVPGMRDAANDSDAIDTAVEFHNKFLFLCTIEAGAA